MSFKSTLRTGAVAVLALAAGQAVAAGDATAGKIKAEACLGCHGAPNVTNAYPTFHVPRIAGQHAAYIVSALQGYKAGQRDHKTMEAQAASLSAADMADIAAYFAAGAKQ